MLIQSFIKKIFSGTNTNTLISAKDLVPDFNRSMLSESNIELLESYKKEYRIILNSNKYLISKNLEIDDILDDSQMHTNLLLNNIKDVINQVNISKLNYYKNEIMFNYEKLVIKLIALKEIYLEKKYLITRNKRAALLNEIEIIQVSLLTVSNQIHAINLEIDTYIQSSDQQEMSISSMGESINYYRYLCKYIINDINIDKERCLDTLVYIEIMIEKYLYKNKERIIILRNKLEELKVKFENDNSKDISVDLNKIEREFLLHKEFGTKIVSEEDFENLYTLKFNFLTRNVNVDKPTFGYMSPFAKHCCNEIEIETYINIIHGIIDAFTMNYSFSNRAMIKNFLLDSSRQYNAEYILMNKEKLAFLLAIEKEKGFEKFFKEFKTYIYPKNYLMTDIFEWEEEIPLYSLYSFYLRRHYDKAAFINTNLLKVFNGLQKEREDQITIYEGITSINLTLNEMEDRTLPEQEHSRTVLKNIYNMDVIMPSSLKSINIDIRTDDIDLTLRSLIPDNYYKQHGKIREFRIDSLILNEGLEEVLITIDPKFIINIDDLTIPSTLKSFKVLDSNSNDITSRVIKVTNSLTITNKNIADIVNDEELFAKFVRSFYIKKSNTFANSYENYNIKDLVFIDIIPNFSTFVFQNFGEIYLVTHSANYSLHYCAQGQYNDIITDEEVELIRQKYCFRHKIRGRLMKK